MKEPIKISTPTSTLFSSEQRDALQFHAIVSSVEDCNGQSPSTTQLKHRYDQSSQTLYVMQIPTSVISEQAVTTCVWNLTVTVVVTFPQFSYNLSVAVALPVTPLVLPDVAALFTQNQYSSFALNGKPAGVLVVVPNDSPYPSLPLLMDQLLYLQKTFRKMTLLGVSGISSIAASVNQFLAAVQSHMKLGSCIEFAFADSSDSLLTSMVSCTPGLLYDPRGVITGVAWQSASQFNVSTLCSVP